MQLCNVKYIGPIVLGMLSSFSAFATEGAVNSPAIISGGEIFKMVFSLIFVIGLMIGLAYFIRRYNPQFAPSTGMRIVAAMSLGGRDRLVLIALGGKQILLGVSPGRVSHVQTFEEPIIPIEENQEVMANSFRKLLSKAQKKL